jgi:CRP-like cAMP-binding protein
MPLFEELDAAELQSVADAMHERTFGAGETVVVQGELPEGFFVVVEGEAVAAAEGVQIGRLEPGDWFGEIALLMGSTRMATITATTDLRCYGLEPPDFRTLVEGNPTIAWKLLQSMASRLS